MQSHFVAGRILIQNFLYKELYTVHVYTNVVSIHQFICYTIYLLRVMRKLEPITVEFSQRAGLTQSQKTIYTQIHTSGQFRVTRWPNLHVFGLLEKTEAPKCSNMQTPCSPLLYKKIQNREFTKVSLRNYLYYHCRRFGHRHTHFNNRKQISRN